MKSYPLSIISFLLLGILLSSQTADALAIIKNVADFNNQAFVHIDFETSSGQGSSGDINAFLNGTGATYSGPNPVNTSSISNSGGGFLGGFDGGAVSGTGHIRGSGYTLSMSFANPIDAFGFFLGGIHFASSTNFTVTLSDGSTANIPINSLHIPANQDTTPSTEAINGFIGVDSNDGPLIQSFSFFHTSDTHSLDDIFFGTANFSNTVGVQPFSESGELSGTQAPAFPNSGSAIPEPSTIVLVFSGLFLLIKRVPRRSK